LFNSVLHLQSYYKYYKKYYKKYCNTFFTIDNNPDDWTVDTHLESWMRTLRLLSWWADSVACGRVLCM